MRYDIERGSGAPAGPTRPSKMRGPGAELAVASFLTRPPSRLRNTSPSLPHAVGARGGDADQRGSAVAQTGAPALVGYAREELFLGGGLARRLGACTRVLLSLCRAAIGLGFLCPPRLPLVVLLKDR